tara:strand:+ start:410536 stop:411636 length:1101 start_codon:yes stop_codon:yes gene_type:complete
MVAMRLYFSALLLSSFLSFPALSAHAEDKLFMHNSDSLSGTITNYSEQSITIKTAYGLFDVPLTHIQGAYAAGDDAQAQAIHLLLAQNSQHHAEQGEVDLANNAPLSITDMAQDSAAHVMPEPTESSKETKTLERAKAADPRGLWGAKWSGRVDFGVDLKTGNTEMSGIDADGVLKAEWDKHKTALALSYSREEEDSDISVNKRSLKLSDDYFYSEKWFIGSLAKFEQDEIDRLDLRSVLSTGLGYQPYKRDDLNLKFIMGPGYQYEEFDDGSDDSSTVLNWRMAYDQKFSEDSFRLFHEHELSTPMDDFNAYLFESETGIRVPITKGIVASAQIDFDWDNDPAAFTVEDDTSYSIRLGYEWMHKK